MIITHTVNHNGHRRIYLGGKGCLDAWLEPQEDAVHWRFRYDASQANEHITAADILAWATDLMQRLAAALGVPFVALDDVPFERIAQLHSTPTIHGRRIPTPQREMIETGYMPTTPGAIRRKADFSAADFNKYHGKGRTRSG